MRLYSVRGLPTTFIIDWNGQVRHPQTGAITQAMRDKLRKGEKEVNRGYQYSP